MSRSLLRAAGALTLALAALPTLATPAVEALGKDYTFPNQIEGFPARLSDFKGLQISSFQTNDGVRLSYWEAGQGEPIVFVPGWSANGAEYVNVMYLLSKHYRVIVLDPRNQGLSQHVDFGNRIARYSADLKDLTESLHLKSFDLCGWSMGASVVWGYVDLYGTHGVRKLVFIDEPISIYGHADWSEQQRQDAGSITSSTERMVDAFVKGTPTNSLYVNSQAFQHYLQNDSPYFVNSESFAREFIKNDPKQVSLVLFDHAVADWRDVVQHKIDVPAAIFTGEYSDSLTGQRWLHSVIPGSTIFVYSKAEQGDHFLAFKNPIKFTTDLQAFLQK